ncbi:CYTH domain-containing protein [Hamadaea tsunoensis]|uniref:hypothetical protein n=1 Tax=Hamadaea tsunoensis TaxID=53368 RepID=UPI000420840A|nr:hypothetical protein [Hamadaea tsunoensis]
MASHVRRPGEGKYAKLEYERRFLLSRLPADAVDPCLIEDRYVTGSRFRVRRMERDGQVVHKFCQKVRPDGGGPLVVAITNMYLSTAEYALLSSLPAATLSKTRWQWGPFAVDEFHGPLSGLLLAETELADPHQDVPVRDPMTAEVTNDERFTGGFLATADAEQITDLLTSFPANR